MESFIGALKSKTVWFGIIQELWALAQIWGNDGVVFDAAVLTPVATGILTIVLRAVTTTSLSSKA